LRAGEVLPGGTELLGRDGAAVDLHAVDDDAALGVAAQQDALDLGQRGEADQRVARRGGGDEQVEVADRVTPAAERPGDLGALRGGQRTQSSEQRLHQWGDEVARAALLAPGLALRLAGGEDLLHRLRAHARQPGEPPGAARLLEV